ncbi:MAG: flagellar motor switch protein FliG [Thermoanaerobacterales bacterium]|nr:flagellar motor switch protein FliG [Bacillota bacterium]MDI6906140.1 flagellar motor switch protein FliG [Thermoanaerobacterales bacterium]
MPVSTVRSKGLQKAAVLLVSLGADLSARILKQGFQEQEIEQITYTISNLGRVKPEERESVLKEFEDLHQARTFIVTGGIGYARDVLEKAVGPHKADEIIKKLMTTGKIMPFSSLRKADPRQLLNFVRDEHPQTIALTMAYLHPDQAAGILAELPEDIQKDVAKRVATMERASLEMVDEVERILDRKLSSFSQEDRTAEGGVELLVNILNAADRATEKAILDQLEADDPALAEEVRRRMFVFEDIIKLDNVFIQRILNEVNPKDLAVALRGANEEVRQRIFKNQSQRAAQMLKDEIDYMGPVRLRDVEEAQQRIVKVIRALEEAGEIIIARGGEDAVLV